MGNLVDALRREVESEKRKSKTGRTLLGNAVNRLEEMQRENGVLQAMKDFMIKNIDSVSAAIIEAQRETIQAIYSDKNIKALRGAEELVFSSRALIYQCCSFSCPYTKDLQGGDVIVMGDQ